MTSPHLCVLLSLIVACSTADLKCEEATPPLHNWNYTEIYGKWIYIAGVADEVESEKVLRSTDSAWMNFQPQNDGQVRIWVTIRLGESCQSRAFYFNISKEASSLALEEAANLAGRVFPVFEDCLLIHYIYKESINKTVNFHYLYCRTADAKDAGMAEFKRRLQCQGISLEKVAIVPQLKEPCPEEDQTKVKEEPETKINNNTS